MEVAGCKRQDGRRMLNFIDRFKSPPCIRQHPSEIVTVFLTQDTRLLTRGAFRRPFLIEREGSDGTLPEEPCDPIVSGVDSVHHRLVTRMAGLGSSGWPDWKKPYTWFHRMGAVTGNQRRPLAAFPTGSG
jgi:hypothetical protein